MHRFGKGSCFYIECAVGNDVAVSRFARRIAYQTCAVGVEQHAVFGGEVFAAVGNQNFRQGGAAHDIVPPELGHFRRKRQACQLGAVKEHA